MPRNYLESWKVQGSTVTPQNSFGASTLNKQWPLYSANAAISGKDMLTNFTGDGLDAADLNLSANDWWIAPSAGNPMDPGGVRYDRIKGWTQMEGWAFYYPGNVGLLTPGIRPPTGLPGTPPAKLNPGAADPTGGLPWRPLPANGKDPACQTVLGKKGDATRSNGIYRRLKVYVHWNRKLNTHYEPNTGVSYEVKKIPQGDNPEGLPVAR